MAHARLLQLLCVLLLRSAAGFFASPLAARCRAARCRVGASSVTDQVHSGEPSDDGYDDFDFDAEEDDEEIDIDAVMPSIVRIYAQTAEPNLALPWQRERPFESSGTGFAIALANGTMRVLTNAHVVEHASVLQVRRRGDDRKYEARVVALGAECDLALLQVDDDDAFVEAEEPVSSAATTARPNFWDWPKRARRSRGAFWRGAPPLEWGPLPRLQDEVAVVGFPVGGESVSVTAGVVSRIELTDYAQSPGSRLLTLQIDAAINAGNSGGPVFDEFFKIVGVAFQSIGDDDAENIGYVIPVTIARHFLEDVSRHGQYVGFPALGVKWQPLEARALRRHLGLRVRPSGGHGGSEEDRETSEDTGVLIRAVDPTSPAAQLLQRGDVLLNIDGVSIANDGSIPLSSTLRSARSLRAQHSSAAELPTPDAAQQSPEASHRRKAGAVANSQADLLERVTFSAMMASRHVGDSVRIALLRPGNESASPTDTPTAACARLTVDVPLWLSCALVPPHLPARGPAMGSIAKGDAAVAAAPYIVIAGLVFVVATRPYISQELRDMGYMDDGEATMPNTRDEVRGSTPVSPRRICDSRALRDRRSTTSSRSRLTAHERNLMSRWSSARNVWHIARISGTPTWRGCASCASMARKWPRFEIWPPNSQPRSSPSTPSSSCLSFSPAVCWSRSTPRPRSVRPPTCAQPTPFPRQCAHRSAPILLKSCPQASGLFPWARGPLQPHLHSRAALDRFSRPSLGLGLFLKNTRSGPDATAGLESHEQKGRHRRLQAPRSTPCLRGGAFCTIARTTARS